MTPFKCPSKLPKSSPNSLLVTICPKEAQEGLEGQIRAPNQPGAPVLLLDLGDHHLHVLPAHEAPAEGTKRGQGGSEEVAGAST